MATRNRQFGQPIMVNRERKALAPLNLKNSNRENNFAQNSKQSHPTFDKAFHQQQPKLTENFKANLENQENFDPIIVKNYQKDNNQIGCNAKSSFTIYTENSVQGKDQEDILQENIEAVAKELDNFLSDSFSDESFNDKNHAKNENSLNESLMNVDEEKENSLENTIPMDSDEDEDPEESVRQRSELSYVQHNSDLAMLSEYSQSIWVYMLQKERQFMANPFYMDKQTHINTKMRSILIDWIVDVCDEYNLKDETFFLATSYIDRFLSNFTITRQEFQLLGTSALLIAAKYEEIYPPEISEFIYITDDSFTKDQILVMERNILNGLSFDISVPTCNYFLEMFSSELSLEKPTYCFAKYLIFLSTLECSPFLKYYPSEIALCSILIAVKILQIEDQIPIAFIQKSFCYEKSLANQGDVQQLIKERNDLMEAMNQLRIYAGQHPQQAIQKRYSDNKYCNVSKIAQAI